MLPVTLLFQRTWRRAAHRVEQPGRSRKHIMREYFFRAILMVILTLSVAACQSGGGAGSGPDQSLVLYSGRSESLVAPIIEQFQAETGIQVQVRYGSTAGLAATLLEEGQNSPADLFWAQDPGGLGVVAGAGLLRQLPADLLSRVPDRYQSAQGDWVGVAGRVRVVVYNTTALSPADLPDDLAGFTDPVWKGRLGWAPTNGSLQVMVTGMRKIWGESATRAWLQAFVENEPQVYENNTSVVQAVANGEVDAGLVNHYYLFRFLQEEGQSFPARNYFLPGGGPGSLVMVAGVGMLRTAGNEDQAERFIRFLLSEDAQMYFAAETFEYPLVDGVPVHPELTPLAQIQGVDIALQDLADLQGTVSLLQEVGALP